MFPTKLVAATVAGAAFGAGALALTPALASDTAGSSSSTAAHAGKHAGQHPGRHAGVARLRGVIHADWTTGNKVHHEAIRGTVTAVSASAITVRASDGVSETFAVTSATKVRMAGSGTQGTSPISDVRTGDLALVVGKDAHQATHVVARAAKSGSGRSSGTTQG